MNKGVRLSRISRRFGKDTALRDIDLAFSWNGMIAIVGPSGSGKSTLLNILGMLDADYQGNAVVLGQDPRSLTMEERSSFRLRNIGYVFQNYSLLEQETAEANVLMVFDALSGDSRRKKKEKARDLLNAVGLKDKVNQKVSTLSGGEKQRVAIARALANDPSLVLADEPTGALDEKNGTEVFQLLRRISASRLVVVVSHDEEGVRKYADKIIRLADGRVVEKEAIRETEKEGDLLFGGMSHFKSRPSLSNLFLYSHARRIAKGKRFRTLLSQGAVAMGILGLGMSNYLSSSVSGLLQDAFSSLVPPNQIVLSPKEEGLPPLSNIYAATSKEAKYLEETYPDYVEGHGSTLLFDFEEYFCDDNYFSYQSGADTLLFSGLSARSINDFLWPEEQTDSPWYPESLPEDMDWSELALGLPFGSMASLCFSLHIERSYEALGQYCAGGKFHLILHVSHEDWEFYDEEIFTVVAVCQSRFPCLYHPQRDWNHRVFIEQMHFRSSQSEEGETPQDVYEIPYVHILSSLSQFLKVVRGDREVRHLVYEMASASYLPTIYPSGTRCRLPRVYLYGADKNGVGYDVLDEAEQLCPEIRGRIPVSQGGFYADASSMMMGFVGKFFLCPEEERIDSCIDLYSELGKSEADRLHGLPDGVVDGSLLNSGSKGLRVSADCSGIKKGRKPEYTHEVVLSSGLYKKWGNPSSLRVAAEVERTETETVVRRVFEKAELTVVGVKEEGHDTIFVQKDWTVDFFLDEVRMSAFLLEPMGCVFSVGNASEGKEAMARLEKAFPAYRVGSPSQAVASSIEETLGYLGTILYAFSAIALSVSTLLFFLVMSLTMKENEAEGKLLHVLGIGQRDIRRAYRMQAYYHAGSSLLSAFLGMALSQIAASFYLSQAFGADFSIHLAWPPFLLMFGATAAFVLLINLWMGFYLKRKTIT